MRRKLLLFALPLVLSPVLAAEARACSCVEYGTPVCAAYWRADAVFTGVVTDFKALPDRAPDAMPLALLHFIIEDKFRNVVAAELDVETLHGTSCDMTFKKGERWLVYAYRDAATGRLAISPCTRTHRLNGMDEDLSYINGLRRNPPEQSISGRLKRDGYEPLAGLKVTVTGGSQSFETTTDGDGDFKVSLPKPGAYTVRATVPFSAGGASYTAKVEEEATDEKTDLKYPVEIPPGQCAYDEIEVYRVDLHATALVSGKVSDEAGEPVTHGSVHLVEAVPQEGEEPRGRFTQIGEDGSFKFENVPVGSFVLVINPRDEAPSQYDAPHPRTFYPGVAEREQASPLVITEGLKVEGINFRVRGPLRKRVVTGTIVRPDGKPAAEAQVSLYNGDKYVLMVMTDERGRFTLEAYGDFDYRLAAAAYIEVPGTRDKVSAKSEKVKLPPDSNPVPLVLKLKRE